MKYNKVPYTYKQQAEKIISNGLFATEKELVERLKNVSYFRLKSYLIPYRDDNKKYFSGSNFTQVWANYTFDRQLRLLVLDGIERVEVAV